MQCGQTAQTGRLETPEQYRDKETTMFQQHSKDDGGDCTRSHSRFTGAARESEPAELAARLAQMHERQVRQQRTARRNQHFLQCPAVKGSAVGWCAAVSCKDLRVCAATKSIRGACAREREWMCARVCLRTRSQAQAQARLWRGLPEKAERRRDTVGCLGLRA